MADSLILVALAADPGRYHLIHVRDAREFAAGHVTGAVHIPLAELAARLGEIAPDRIPVTICGKGGGRSAEGAELLIRLGRDEALALESGTLGWLAAQAKP